MILITGANRGLGAALLAHYRSEEAEVLGTTRQPQGDLLPLDVSDPASITDLAARLSDQPIDLLICNAGAYFDRGMGLGDTYDADIFARSFATNATGPFLTVQALLPNLRAASPSKVAIISSQMGSNTRARGGSYAYRASKAAVLNIGRNLATDLADEGIAVGIYHPGWVISGMTAGSAANIEAGDSARGLAARFAALGPETTGCFETWEGQAMPL
ncbi:SDR family NAD(P)-dependent oxidoreductase [Frigidibacter sp. ROC022]|uniref:SDR family NAD(P)-dependent oxidoreductase n=1 Tax=Frigidibacter sp. ROC022 TaxID=2971796 RepID=UPI00215A19F4|nr:SDR family NAD(P)-dependent oxidoreductase [Frigidibacter sp. ROC022]MCR8726635.1 SDR family NAD(P)-dependent oxidoreductase [Frigidibacter sp. ROC022]